MRSITILVVLVVLLSACGSRVEEGASGQEIYESVCARCHRSDLSGGVGPALGVGSPSSEQPIGYFLQTVERGKGRMPSFGGTLSEPQLQSVVAYILEQQGRADE